jgi:hypothetical protein
MLADDGGTSLGGADTSQPQTFNIDVNYDHPWHNRVIALDVDGDTHIAPNDAIGIINFINAFGSQAVPKNGTASGPFYDVNGDGFIAPNDVVEVINRINAAGAAGEAEAGGDQTIVAAETGVDDVMTLLAADVAGQGKRRP